MSTQPVGLPRRRLLRGALAFAGTTGVVAAPLLAGCAAPRVRTQDAAALAPSRIRVGDCWLYREINRYNGSEVNRIEEIVTAIEPAVVVRTRILASEFSAGRVLRPDTVDDGRFDAQWRVSRELIYEQPLEFAAPMPLLPVPIVVGASRSDQTTFTVRGVTGRFTWQQRLTALGMVRVDTPAGRFASLHVRREIRLQSPDPFRFDASRVDELYYAPEVNRWVRREWTGRYRHEAHLDEQGTFRQEDWIRRDLVDYRPAT